MKLKRLDIHGFKSFYHRTTVVFDDGITAVVGPNGCGKSNIVDGLKWVMGEQGARALRGQQMDDVVFGGSDKRGPMGLCEVRLTFHNDGSAEVPAQWQAHEEIAVERRLERGKGSDYFINRQRVRLSDVQELLAGTGIGSGPGGGGQRAYAIIEQGQIGRIVSAKADERRVLIEEAAGITRYRARKRTAEKKMEETAANLERLYDVISEVEVRQKSVRRQALKAERHREYRLEAEQLGQGLLAAELRAHRAEDAILTAAEQAALADEAETGAAVRAAEAALAEAEAAVEAAGGAARAAAERLAAHERALALAQGQLESLGREEEALVQQAEGLAAEAQACAAREGELAQEAEAAAATLGALNAEAEADEAALKAQDAQRAEAHRALLEARAAAERLRREAAQEAEAGAQAAAEQAAARRQSLDRRERAAAAAEEGAHHAAQRPALAEAVAQAEAAVTEGEAALVAARTAQAENEALRARLEPATRAAVARERAAGEQIANLGGRLRSIEEMEARHEDLGEAGRILLGAGLAGVQGPAAALFEAVPAELEAAVAAALDARLKAVVVADGAAVDAALAHLADAHRGRAVLALADGEAPITRRPPAHPGLEGRLADLAGVTTGLGAALLGDALLARDLAAARDLARLWPWPVVTRAGARVEGAVFVVAGGQGADPAPLRRRRDLKALKARVGDLEAERAQAHQEVEAAQAGLAAAVEAGKAAAAATHRAELRVAEAQRDLSGARRDQANLEAAIERFGRVAAGLAREAEAAEEEAERCAERAADLAARRTDRGAAIAAAEGRAQAAEAHRDAAVEALHRARTQAVARRERADAVAATHGRIVRQIEELRTRQARAERGRIELLARREAAHAHRADLAETRTRGAEAAALERTALQAARATEQGATEALRGARASTQAARQAWHGARERLTEARLAVQASRLRLDHLEEAARMRFGLAAAELLARTEGAPPPDAEARARHDQLWGLLEQMGDVNPEAIAEFAEVSERYTFLCEQQQDLQAALADLHTAIARIDDTSRQLFADTFAAVNAQFSALFPRLFRGGEAELTLTEPEDLLNTGIEMWVCPPGKKVQNVTLLSGGEKALCAIALIFAVFRVKPSPFCLLDEVDAPLDDANIGRFNELVREMARSSQIVLITHNKRTMEIADILYGITMEEPGVSKLVGVRMA